MPIKYTAPIRRGLVAIIAALQEDTDIDLADPKHWAGRKLDRRSHKCFVAAIDWMIQEAHAQADRDGRPRVPRNRDRSAILETPSPALERTSPALETPAPLFTPHQDDDGAPDPLDAREIDEPDHDREQAAYEEGRRAGRLYHQRGPGHYPGNPYVSTSRADVTGATLPIAEAWERGFTQGMKEEGSAEK